MPTFSICLFATLESLFKAQGKNNEGENWLEKSFTKNNNSNKKFMTNSKAAPRASVYIEFTLIIIQFLVNISVQKGFGLQTKLIIHDSYVLTCYTSIQRIQRWKFAV